ncbi:hypothetical protein E2C01_022761 [Portunus trituberculatus]|uniref:Uncharacterized protein n=1 Tax=Portunus trituberculatus TaxID=210409 RepID=A0A5B7E960_PORTR|nr:hypothetical protein [Portunus trituberculatus]
MEAAARTFQCNREDVSVSLLGERQHTHVLLVVSAGTQHHLHCALHQPLHLTRLSGERERSEPNTTTPQQQYLPKKDREPRTITTPQHKYISLSAKKNRDSKATAPQQQYLSESASLIGADRGDTAQRLHSLQALDESRALGHATDT